MKRKRSLQLYQKALTLEPKPDQVERLKKKISDLQEKR